MLVVPNKWTLEEALLLIRKVQPECKKFGYHLCLGGGVLNNGHSKKDLDLYFLPMGETRGDALLKWMQSIWGQGKSFKGIPRLNAWGEPIEIGYDEVNGKPIYDYPDEPHYSFTGKFMYGTLRIDVFIIGGEKLELSSKEDTKEKGVDGVDIVLDPFVGEMVGVDEPAQPHHVPQQGVVGVLGNQHLPLNRRYVGGVVGRVVAAAAPAAEHFRWIDNIVRGR